MRVPGGMTARGSYISLLLVVAATFGILGLVLSYGVGVHSQSIARDVGPRTTDLAGPVRPITAAGESPFVSVVDKSYNSVVNITAARRYRSRYQDMYDEFWHRFFGLRQRDPVIPSFGSGFIVSPDGYIVTNNHVVEGSESITVTLADRSTFRANLVGADRATDLALLKIDTKDNLSYISFGSSRDMKIGDWVVAIGNPFPSLGLDRTVTVGVVSGKGRSPMSVADGGPRYQDYIQTDASINPGNSGGPLLNLNGEVIGVNSAIASPSGGSVGIGFAIPSDLAGKIVSEIMAEGRVTRGWLGVLMRDLTRDEAEMVGLDKPYGVYLDDVTSGSPAELGGLRPDDVVISFNGERVADARDFQLKVAGADAGDEVTLELLRRGKPQNLRVVLGDMDAQPSQAVIAGDRGSRRQVPEIAGDFSQRWLGMRAADCTPELAAKLGVNFHTGAIVVDVEQGSPADARGVVPGTIIVEINYVPILGKADFDKVANDLRGRSLAIAFHVLDTSGRIRYIPIKPK